MECQKFAEMEMNQYFGKTLATHFHVINLHIYKHAYTHRRNNNLHIYKHAYTRRRPAGHTNMHILQLLT